MLLMLAAPGLSQSEDEPYFSLSSNAHLRRGRQTLRLAQRLERDGRWSSACTASTIPCSSSSNWRARTNSAGACRVRRTSAPCWSAYTRGSTACGPASGAACAASSRNRPARTWRTLSPADRSPPRPRRRPAERSTPKLRCSTRSNWCSPSTTRRRATIAGTARTWRSASRIAASTWWKRCAANCARTPSSWSATW